MTNDTRRMLTAAIISTAFVEGCLLGMAGLAYTLMGTHFFKTVMIILWLIGSLAIAFAGGRMYGRIELRRELDRA